MTNFPPPVIAARMGRPPLDRKDVTVKTTLRIPRKLLARIVALTGENRMSSWMREAMEEKLEREERAKFTKPD